MALRRFTAFAVAPGVLVGICLLAGVAAVTTSAASLRQAAPREARDAATTAASAQGSLPIVAEHRYRMAAKIRPLLLFWIGRDNVGGARLRWRKGEEASRGYDVLIGSDPARAPRQINRWGFLLEESNGIETTVVGVMKRSDEDSLDQAKSGIAAEGKEGFFFKMIRARSDARESVATVTVTRVAHDYSYRDIEVLLDALARYPGEPRVRRIAQPAGARVGFLTGLFELMTDAVESAKRDRRRPGPKSVAYAYFGKQYDLTRTRADILSNATFGAATYPKVVQAEFVLRARGDSSTEAFTIACAIDGPLDGIPVFAAYQPKWWFKAELVLDERQTF